MPSLMSFAVVFLGFLGLAMLIFSAVHFREPSPVAKTTSLVCLLIAAAAGSASAFLFIAEKSWHLPNAQKPWLLTDTLGGMAPVFMVLALLTAMRVVAAKEAETEREAEATGKPGPPEGVWPPPPTGP